MKKSIALSLLLLFPVCVSAAGEGAKQTTRVEVRKAGDAGSLRGMLDQVWARLRSYGPTASARDVAGQGTLVAGVRGAETTTSTLTPYWKGDKSQDPAYREEVGAYTRAQALADAGDLKQAATAFDAFLKTYPASSLKPNVQFAMGLSYAGMGDKTKGSAYLQSFVKDYPSHPLAADASRVLGELQKM